MIELPRIRLGHLPTRIEALPRLSAELGGPKLFIKRDDQTGLAFGGNKTRKLEFLAASAKSKGANTLITTGALQSNHCRQAAACAARLGLDCILVLVGSPPEGMSGNILLDHLMGAEIIFAERDNRDEILQASFDEAMNTGREPFLIPYGGSSPTGVAGYVNAMQELKDQVQQDHSELKALPNWILFATSSGGTQAGMVLGGRMIGYQGGILGISVDKESTELKSEINDLANESGEYLDIKASISVEDIVVNDNYLGEGYGVLGDLEIDAIKMFSMIEGILLDPVYTGRAGGGMIDLIGRGFFDYSDTVLFWHTGGLPALFADVYRDRFV